MSLSPPAMLANGTSAAARLRRSIETVFAGDGSQLAKLSDAHTSVSFHVPAEGESVTILLDRDPPSVADSADPAEIAIEMTPEQADAVGAGAVALPELVVRGEILARGPVRRYLEVEPILRAALARACGSTIASTPTRARARPTSGPDARINPELLSIETRGLYKRFGSQEVLRGAELAIPEGLISVVIGPSGTGKSVLLQHIVGLIRPDAGDVLIRGRPLSRMSRSQVLALRTEIGVMFQDGALFSSMNVYDNVAFPLRQHTDLGEREVREAVEKRLAAVGLTRAAHAMPATLSGGMKKRAGLARALVLEPTIVLCDEPDSGLDPVRTALLGDLLVEQHVETGGTMVVITHNIALAKDVGEHISVMWQGSILESGMRDDVLASRSEFVQQFLSGDALGPLGMDA